MVEIIHANEAKVFWNNVYAHGKLESLIGYDLIGSTEAAPSEGINTASYKGKPVLVFVWKGRFHDTGLAVLTTDVESIEYAVKTYEEKRKTF